MKYIFIMSWYVVWNVTIPCDDSGAIKRVDGSCYKEKPILEKEYFSNKPEAMDYAIKLHGKTRSFDGYIGIKDINMDSVHVDSINLIEILK